MHILINSPSLNALKNVSGISTVVNLIIENNKAHNYFHFEVGKKDNNCGLFLNYIILFIRILYYPFFIKKNKVNLIHQNVPFDSKGILREFILNKIGRLLKIKRVIHIHGGRFIFDKPTNFLLNHCLKSLLLHNEKVIVLSESEKKSLSKIYDFNNSIVLTNAVHLEYQSLERTFSNVPAFLFMGRIHESKGIYEIIDMCNKLKNIFKFKLFMYGDGPIRGETIGRLTRILGNDFHYGGVVSGSDKLQAFLKADYFLLPSKYGEGVPMALLEAMSIGLIPIVTNDGSMEILIKDKINGIKVEKNNSKDLLNKIVEIVTNNSLKYEISQNAFNTIARFHNINEYVKCLNIIYR